MGHARCQDAHPDFCSQVTWDNLAWHLLGLPTIVLTALMVTVMPLTNLMWVRHHKSRIVTTMRRLFGTLDSETVKHPWMRNACFLVELVLSVWFVLQWVQRSYSHEVSEAEIVTDQILCSFFLVTYVINASRHQFAVTYALQPTALITLFTVVPTFAKAPEDSVQWFSFSFLRVANAVNAYEKLEATGALEDVSEVKRGVAITLLRTMVLVVIMAGTTFCLEVLGDPEQIQDRFITTEMGQISFIQMFYWTFTTISTVGYGDFSPKTSLSRMFTVVSIVVGVVFFSTEVASLAGLYKAQSKGLGKWKPYQSSNHVIVIGSGVAGASAQIISFVQELFCDVYLNENGGPGWPNVSFMAAVEQPRELKDAIAAMPRQARFRCTYFMGDPQQYKDAERLRMGEAKLVIVIPDITVANIDQEDTNNLLRALAVRQFYPHVNLKLMLQKPSSEAKAVRAGVPAYQCLNFNELKCNIFALAGPIRGWSTIMAHCLISTQDLDIDFDTDSTKVEEWFRDFKCAGNCDIVGFIVKEKFVGTDWCDFVKKASRAGIMPLAVQVKGRVLMNPIGMCLYSGQIVFAFSHGKDHRMFEEPNTHYEEIFLQQQADYENRANGGAVDQNCEDHNGVKQAPSQKLADTALAVSATLLKWREKVPLSVSPPVMFGGEHKAKRQTKKLDDHAGRRHTFFEEHFEEIKKEKPRMNDLEERAREIAEAGGHCILVFLTGNPSQMTQAYLGAVRGAHVPWALPLIVLTKGSVPHSDTFLSTCFSSPGVGLLVGSGLVISVSDVTRAGLMKARCVLLFSGLASEVKVSDKQMIDGVGVTMLAAIEGCLCDQDGEYSTHIVLEMHRQDSLRFMHRFPLNEEVFTDGGCQWKFEPNEAFENHPRFASGNIFSASCVGAMLAKAYYTPGIIEIMEKLCVEVGGSTPWQVTVPPKLVGKTYGDLAEEFCRAEHGALCMGLYRLCFPDTRSTVGYVLTNPDPDTKLRRNDLITVLAPPEFGKACFERGMIAVQSPAHHKEDKDDRKSSEPSKEIIDESVGSFMPAKRSSVSMKSSPPSTGQASPGDWTAPTSPDTSPSVKKSALAGSSKKLQAQEEMLARVADANDPPLASGTADDFEASTPFAGTQSTASTTSKGQDMRAWPSQVPPILTTLQKELAVAHGELAESRAREAALRSQLRACSFPPANPTTAGSQRGSSSLTTPRGTDVSRTLQTCVADLPPINEGQVHWSQCCGPHRERAVVHRIA